MIDQGQRRQHSSRRSVSAQQNEVRKEGRTIALFTHFSVLSTTHCLMYCLLVGSHKSLRNYSHGHDGHLTNYPNERTRHLAAISSIALTPGRIEMWVQGEGGGQKFIPKNRSRRSDLRIDSRPSKTSFVNPNPLLLFVRRERCLRATKCASILAKQVLISNSRP